MPLSPSRAPLAPGSIPSYPRATHTSPRRRSLFTARRQAHPRNMRPSPISVASCASRRLRAARRDLSRRSCRGVTNLSLNHDSFARLPRRRRPRPRHRAHDRVETARRDELDDMRLSATPHGGDVGRSLVGGFTLSAAVVELLDGDAPRLGELSTPARAARGADFRERATRRSCAPSPRRRGVSPRVAGSFRRSRTIRPRSFALERSGRCCRLASFPAGRSPSAGANPPPRRLCTSLQGFSDALSRCHDPHLPRSAHTSPGRAPRRRAAREPRPRGRAPASRLARGRGPRVVRPRRRERWSTRGSRARGSTEPASTAPTCSARGSMARASWARRSRTRCCSTPRCAGLS